MQIRLRQTILGRAGGIKHRVVLSQFGLVQFTGKMTFKRFG